MPLEGPKLSILKEVREVVKGTWTAPFQDLAVFHTFYTMQEMSRTLRGPVEGLDVNLEKSTSTDLWILKENNSKDIIIIRSAPPPGLE